MRSAILLALGFVALACNSAENADRDYVRGRVAVARIAGVIDVDTLREVRARCSRMKAPINDCAEAERYARTP